MEAADLCYPIILIDQSEALIAAFASCKDFAWYGPPYPRLRRVGDAQIIDADNRLFAVRAFAALGFRGSWRDRIRQAVSRRRVVTFDLVDESNLTWVQCLDIVCTEVDRQFSEPENPLSSEARVPGAEQAEALERRMMQAFEVEKAALRQCRDIHDLVTLLGPRKSSPGSWFSGAGRTGRGEFLFLTAVIGLWFCLFQLFDERFVAGAEPPWFKVLGAAAVGPCYFILMAAGSRRLHDLGASGGWAWFIFFTVLLIAAVASGVSHSTSITVLTAFSAVGLLGLPPSEPRDNDYGPYSKAFVGDGETG